MDFNKREVFANLLIDEGRNHGQRTGVPYFNFD